MESDTVGSILGHICGNEADRNRITASAIHQNTQIEISRSLRFARQLNAILVLFSHLNYA